MKRIISLLFCMFIIFSFSYTFAVGIDMDINEVGENISVEDSNETVENTYSIFSHESSKVSTTQTDVDDEFKLTVSDIINIILIAVGIVIIFLAIAILIKLK